MSLREEMTSLRQKFQKTQADQEAAARAADRAPRIAAADKFLNGLADRLVDSIKEKVSKNEVEDVNMAIWASPSKRGDDASEKTEPAVIFKDKSLDKVSDLEMSRTSGYARIKEICARPDVDMCLGEPDGCTIMLDKKKSSSLRIFINLPYSSSQTLYVEVLKQPAKINSHPGVGFHPSAKN